MSTAHVRPVSAESPDEVVAAQSETVSLGTGYLLWLAAWFGLVAGMLETARNANHRFVREQLVGISRHGYWMAPLTDLGIMLAIGLVLLLVRRVRPQWVTPWRVLFVYLFMGVLMVLLSMRMLQQTMWISVLLLTLGISFQLTRWLHRRWSGLLKWMRRTTLPLILIWSGIVWLAFGSKYGDEADAIAALPDPPQGVPNVLLITLDTVRAENLSLYGYDRETTPLLEELAASSTVFEMAYATSPYTLPTHASLFTGHYPHALSCDWTTPLNDEMPTLAEVLRDRGYRTGGFVANMVFCGYEFGLNRGFIRYEDYPLSVEQVLKSSALVRMLTNDPESTGARLALPLMRWLFGFRDYLARKSAAEVNREFLDWLDEDRDRPFFAFVNYFDAHHPYLPPSPYEAMYAEGSPAGRHPQRNPGFPDNAYELSAEEIQAEEDAYDGAIRYIDDQLRRLLNELQKRGVLDDTLLIITSDHGEQFGEHDLFLHGNSLYRQCLHVPLLIRLPGNVAEGRRIERPVTLRDLPATVFELTRQGAEKALPGESLARFWNAADEEETSASSSTLAEVGYLEGPVNYPVSHGDLKSIVLDGRQYIVSSAGSEELYELESDPQQINNLADTAEGEALLPTYRQALRATVPNLFPIPPPSENGEP